MRQVENLSLFMFCRGAGHRVQLYKVSIKIIMVFTFFMEAILFFKNLLRIKS